MVEHVTAAVAKTVEELPMHIEPELRSDDAHNRSPECKDE